MNSLPMLIPACVVMIGPHERRGPSSAIGSPVFVNAAASSVNTALCGRIRIPPLIAARKRPR